MNNIEIENACLSSAILSKNALLELIENTEIDDYGEQPNKIIFSALLHLHNNKIDIDLITIKDYLQQQDLLEKIGGASGLIAIYNTASTSANISHYIKRLLECSKSRQLKQIGEETVCEVQDKKNPEDIIHDLQFKLQAIDKERGKHIFPVSEILGKSIHHLQIQRGDYVETGILLLDEKIDGIFPGELVILAARPSLGKTSLALNIGKNVAENENIKNNRVLMFSLEQPSRDIGIRLLVSETNIEFKRLKIAGKLDKYEYERLNQAYEKIKKLNLKINDQILKASNIVNMIRRHSEYEKPGLVIIDYLQLLLPEDKSIQRHLQVQEMTRLFKNFAKDSKIPILLLCQLNRNSENRTNKRPILADLRESGDIEQDADKVLFIYRENIESFETEIIVAKNRNGACGIISGIDFNSIAMVFS